MGVKGGKEKHGLTEMAAPQLLGPAGKGIPALPPDLAHGLERRGGPQREFCEAGGAELLQPMKEEVADTGWRQSFEEELVGKEEHGGMKELDLDLEDEGIPALPPEPARVLKGRGGLQLVFFVAFHGTFFGLTGG